MTLRHHETKNPVELTGLDFVEFAAPDPDRLETLFTEFGFSKTKKHKTRDIDYFQQNDIVFLLNRDEESFAAEFSKLHGPSIASMGWMVKDAEEATSVAAMRGAKVYTGADDALSSCAIYGIGDSLIHFIGPNKGYLGDFIDHPEPIHVKDHGFVSIDHLTNNVEKGTMAHWSDFYKKVFGFTEVRYFDIRGVKTGLTSYALKSPCGTFCIPINEGSEEKSQIEEYLREYKGPGIQHLAFLSNDLLASLDSLREGGTSIETLDIDDQYYQEVFDRVPNVTEDKQRIRDHNVLVDGDEEGYLLQIFTKNVVGPIFIEMIQRKNHYSFGEGNFGALFRSIERDQEKRGVL